MSVPINEYINIISGVAGASLLDGRDSGFRGMCLDVTEFPTGTVIEFKRAKEVGEWFGFTSPQYTFAVQYFGFTSKLVRSPKLLSFYNANIAALGAQYFGTSGGHTVLPADTYNISIDVSGTEESFAVVVASSSSMTDVAADVQTALAAGTDAVFTGATCVYNTDTARLIINFPAGVQTSVTVTPDDAAGTAFLVAVGWSTGSVASLGQDAATIIDERIADSIATSDNFFSTGLCGVDSDASMGLSTSALLNTYNNKFLFLYGSDVALYAAGGDYAANINEMLLTGGTAITAIKDITVTAPDYVEFFPGLICGATSFSDPGAAQSYMYYQYGVYEANAFTDFADYELYTGLGMNIYAQTQTEGQKIAFYQRGAMSGVVGTDIMNIGPYVNEIWIKSSIVAALLNMQLSSPIVSANTAGLQYIESAMQPTIDTALINGSFSVGNTLDISTIGAITTLTNDPRAYLQVENNGYYLTISLSKNGTEFQADYTLIYVMGDSIKFIEGRNIAVSGG